MVEVISPELVKKLSPETKDDIKYFYKEAKETMESVDKCRDWFLTFYGVTSARRGIIRRAILTEMKEGKITGEEGEAISMRIDTFYDDFTKDILDSLKKCDCKFK